MLSKSHFQFIETIVMAIIPSTTLLSPFIGLVLCIFSMAAYPDSEKLDSVHEWIEDAYPAVDHIDAQTYLQAVSSPEDVVLFDVREPEEFAVSHLQGAIQVDPEITEAEFMAQFGDELKDKQVVFYCSVGRRSSLLADKVSDTLFEQGAEEVYNLKHGIFGWHDEQKPLVNASQSTDYVHPFSWRWKRYLKRKDMARYKIPSE